ncbi:unnamed protein product, partial [Adineta steineri]
EMSEQCSVEMCKSSSRTQCHCCKKNFCRSHFNEHDNLPNLQLNTFADEINILNNRLQAFNLNIVTDESRQKLEKWRASCYKIIDDIFEQTCQKIDQRINEKTERQRNEILRINFIIDELIQKQETTMTDIDLLQRAIHETEHDIDNIEYTRFDIISRSLSIDHSLIQIEELHLPQFKLSSLIPPYKTIDRMNGGRQHIAINEQFCLIHQGLDLYLMDQNLTVIKKSQENFDHVYDMCWSPTLARFILLDRRTIFILDPNTMLIQRIPIDQDRRCWSCTCSDTSLFLSTLFCGSSVLQYSLLPSIQFEKEWKSPETCTRRQMIIGTVCKNETIAMIIVDLLEKEKRIELKLSKTFEPLWSLKLDVVYSDGYLSCCSLNDGHWLLSDYSTSSLIHISRDGKILETSTYKEKPCRINLFHRNELIITTDVSINFHRLI